MVTNRNAQAALLATVIGFAVIGGWLFAASYLFGSGPTNLAEEIMFGPVVGGSQVRDITVNGPPVLLVADVTLVVTGTRWRPTRLSGTGASISPSVPENRFLIVDYQITNGREGTLSMDGLVDLFNIVNGTQTVANGHDSESGRGSTITAYGNEVSVQHPLEVEPAESLNGSWFFELDSRISNLRLRSGIARVALRLPVDQITPWLTEETQRKRPHDSPQRPVHHVRPAQGHDPECLRKPCLQHPVAGAVGVTGCDV